MREISFEENRSIQLAILSSFDEYCQKMGLVYFLGYGSLIGCIRHNGFIPWDDDIDLLMPRKDYEKLMLNFNQNNPNKNLRLISPLDTIAKHSIVKIIDVRTVKIEEGIKYKSEKDFLGIDVDVFPIDGQPDDEQKFIEWRRKLTKYYKAYSLMGMDFSRLGIKSKLEKMWFTFLYKNKNNALLKAKALHQKYPYAKCRYVGVCENMYVDEGDRVQKECYEYPIKHQFEGGMFNIPIGYDSVLQSIYGDYMELPPLEMQRAHHKNKVFWKK